MRATTATIVATASSSEDYVSGLRDPSREPTVNRAEIVGYVGGAPELRYTPSGTPVVQFSVATHRWHEDEVGLVQETDWHHLVAFGPAAGDCQRLNAGELVRLRGRLHTRSASNTDRAHRTQTEIIVEEIRVMRRAPRQYALPFLDRSELGATAR